MTITNDTRTPDLLDSLNAEKPGRNEAAAILARCLPLVHGASPEGEGYAQARRTLSAALHHDLDPEAFDEAAGYGSDLTDVRNGADLEHLFGPSNHTREVWDWYLEESMRQCIGRLVAGIPE